MNAWNLKPKLASFVPDVRCIHHTRTLDVLGATLSAVVVDVVVFLVTLSLPFFPAI